MYTAPTAAACAVPANANAAPPVTAAATTAPTALLLPLALRRCVALPPVPSVLRVLPIACLPLCYWGGLVLRQHASEPETDKCSLRGGG
ncbi:hypothetical protein GCM10010273_38650 [Streptomyces lavendulocolor]